MSDAIRRVSGISDAAPHFRRGITEAETLRYSWHKASNIGPLEYTLDQLDAPRSVERWIESWCDGKTTKGLLLSGPSGTGKTTLAKAIAHEVIERSTTSRKRAERMGRTPDNIPAWPVYFANYRDLIADVGRRMTLEQRGRYDDEYDDLDLRLASILAESKRPKWVMQLVVLDDVGKEYRGKLGAESWAAGYINQIMRTREHYGLTTVVTSNHAMSDWDDTYGEAAGSFAHQAFHEVPMDGNDRRRQ